MNPNVGGIDRTLRLTVGPILALVGAVGLLGALPLGTAVGAALLVAGAVLTVTGATRRCPLNSLLGVNTCPVQR
jgi:hypothetical protein